MSETIAYSVLFRADALDRQAWLDQGRRLVITLLQSRGP